MPTRRTARRFIGARCLPLEDRRLFSAPSVVSINWLDPVGSETAPDTASFSVSRDAIMQTPLRVYLDISGPATHPQSIPIRPADYTGTNITFGNGITTSSYVDIPAGAKSTTVTLTPIDDATAEGDEAATFSIAANAAYDIDPNSRSAPIMIRDNDDTGGPAVRSANFLFETSQTLHLVFTQNVFGSIGFEDLEVTGPGNTHPTASTMSYSSYTDAADFGFSALLPDGNYTARVIAPGITNDANQPMAADYTFSFYVLAGDANRDRVVNFADLVVLAQNYGQTGRTFSSGNFDYSSDGAVGFPDLVLLAQRYNTSVLAPGAVQASPMKTRSSVASMIF